MTSEVMLHKWMIQTDNHKVQRQLFLNFWYDIHCMGLDLTHTKSYCTWTWKKNPEFSNDDDDGHKVVTLPYRYVATIELKIENKDYLKNI